MAKNIYEILSDPTAKKAIEIYKKLMTHDAELYETLEDNEEMRRRLSISEVMTTDNANILMPQVIKLVVKEGADPEYLGSRLLQTIRITQGNYLEFPVTGALRAYEIPETGEYLESNLDLAIYGGNPTGVKVKKYGLMVRISEEAISESQWDVIGIHLREAGRALARLKEEQIFNEFSRHGHVVFDNNIRDVIPEAGTTGMDFDGNFNDTLSTQDLLRMFCVLIANGFRPTDIIMHPLCLPLFVENQFIKAYTNGAFANGPIGNAASYVPDPNKNVGPTLGGVNVIYSPFVPFNHVTKRFDLYVVDRNNIGVLVVREDISTEQWTDPSRDIRNIKVKERYGIGILHEGRAVAVARNIAYARSFEPPDRVYNVEMNPNVAKVMNRTIV